MDPLYFGMLLKVICGLIAAKIITWLIRRLLENNPGKSLPYFTYPNLKNYNFYHIKKSALNGSLPKALELRNLYMS